MLPHDQKPWAKTLARTVIGLTLVALVSLAIYLHSLGSLHIPEITGIVLLFLAIVPPNLAIIYPNLMLPRHRPPDNSKPTSVTR